MPGTLTPAQMFDHELNPVKGWPSPYAVDKVATLAASQTYAFAGRAGYLHTDNTLKIGVLHTDLVAGMPLWLFPNGGDFDVSSDVGNISGGKVVCLVGNGGYELETTEYMGTGFTPGKPLQIHGAADADIGKVKVCVFNDDVLIAGVCSGIGPETGGAFKNEFKKLYVRFWPVYLPARTVP